jgi:hypothetical protein
MDERWGWGFAAITTLSPASRSTNAIMRRVTKVRA